ncbi:MAG TPA: S-layer homology domain-containing protein [Thermoanaerobaculia bacterium]
MRQATRHIVFPLLALFLVLITIAVPGRATTIAPPANLGELARVSQSVVLAETADSHSELRGEIPFTLTTFRVLQNVAGREVGRTLTLETPGGVVGKHGFRVPGTPGFAQGGRYLLFLDPAPNGNWRLKMSSYGLLREVPGTGLLAPVAEAGELEVLPRGAEAIGTYREKDLLPQLATAHSGAPWHRQASEATSAELAGLTKAAGAATATATTPNLPGVYVPGAPSACRFVAADPNDADPNKNDFTPIRWFGFETGSSISVWHTTPGQTGIVDGGVAAVQNGAGVWTNHNASAIHLTYAGSKASSANCATNAGFAPGEVTFNDPCTQLPPLNSSCTAASGWTSSTCCGTVAQYGYAYDATQTLAHDNQGWHPMTGFSVVVNKGTQCLGETDFQEMMTHFLGHSLGFEHHADSDATMYVSLGVHSPRGAAIAATDKACASFDYHTFLDVPYNYFAWRFIEAVNNAGVMTTCGNANFCPNDVVTRGSMAVFLLLAKEGGSYVPPPCTSDPFADMPCSNPLAPWVAELVRRGVTAGCGNGNYCPDNQVNRNQMAVFLIKTFEGPSYVPAACTSDPFADVPCSGNPFAPWVKEITDRGITAGCGGGNYCPGNVVNRAQMSVFMSTNFHLPLP